MAVISLISNVASMRTRSALGRATEGVSTSFERLSSGARINRPSDDAAGLSVVATLMAKNAIFTQGIRNLNDGVSMFNIADGAMEALTDIVIRLQ